MFSKKDDGKELESMKNMEYLLGKSSEKIRRLECILLTLGKYGEASFWIRDSDLSFLDFANPPEVEQMESDYVRKVTIRLPKKDAQ